jgi:hypothetical protein
MLLTSSISDTLLELLEPLIDDTWEAKELQLFALLMGSLLSVAALMKYCE